jgi:hypothetical protein
VISTEFEGDPAEGLVGFQQQPVDRLTEHRSRPSGPRLSLGVTVADDAQLITVQFDHGQHAGGQHPVTVVLEEQIFLAGALRQGRGQLGR